jgi:hypothetical protein
MPFDLNNILQKRDLTRLTITEEKGKLIEKKPTPTIPIEEFLKTRLVSNKAKIERIRVPSFLKSLKETELRKAREAGVFGKAPGIPIKVPFIQKEFLVPETGLGEFKKFAVELPEKVGISLGELPYVIKERDVPEYKGKAYRVPSYAEEAENMIIAMTEQGYSEREAIAAAILQTGGQAIIDVVIISDLITMGVKGLLRGTAPSTQQEIAAWKLLGQPKTIVEAGKYRNQLAKQFHPDLVGEQSTTAMAQINDAMNILSKGKIPTKTTLIEMGIEKKVLPLLERGTPITTIFKKTPEGKLIIKSGEDILKELKTYPARMIRPKIPTVGAEPTLPFKQLPGIAYEEKPVFAPGLTIRRMKPVGKDLVKPIPKELEPLAKEARKYKSAEEFVRGNFQKRVIAGQNLIQELKGAGIKKSINSDGTITIYHGTSKSNASQILKSGRINKETFFSPLKAGTKFGDSPLDVAKRKFGKEGTVLEIKIDARDINTAAAGSELFASKQLVKGLDNIWRSIDRPVGKKLADFYTQATKGMKKVRPIIKPKDEFDAYLEKEFGKITPAEETVIWKSEAMKEVGPEIKKAEGQLFRDIRAEGGIKSFRGKFMAEELRSVPSSLKNNKTGKPLDIIADNLKEKGYNFEGDSDLLEVILKIRSEARPMIKPKVISTIRTLKTITEKMPKKTTEVSRRLLNKLYRMKYPRIPAEQKAVRRAIEAGKISPEFEGKTISEMRKIKGFTEPKSVPTERLSIFGNFINLNKIDRKNIPYKQMGIAEIIRGVKTFPAIRKSGFYATKDIQIAPIKDEHSRGFLAPYHMALRQDGYKLGGKFGVMFSKVWKPTEKAIRGQIEFSNLYFKTIKDIGKRYKIRATKKNLEHLSDVIEHKAKATRNEELFIRDIRSVLDDLRNQANGIRQRMGKKEMGYITDYIPHIQKATLWNELLSNVATISDNLDFIIPNQVKNPFAFKRMMEMMPKAERNLYILLDRYIRAISKDIYITPAIENIKAYNSVLKNRELINASRYWDEYIRQGLIGKQHKIDTSLFIGQTGKKTLQKWNDMVNKAFLTGKIAWNIGTQPLSYIMYTPMETGIINSITAIYKSFNKPLRQFVKENSNILAIKTGDVRAVAVGEGRNIQNRIYKTKINKYNDFISMLSSVEERELTLASYIAGLDRAKDLGYKGKDALWFADLASSRTQSMYNRENRALILDSDITRTIFPFSSFSVESFNHLQEISTKGGAIELDARQRTGKLFRLLVGIYLSSLYYKALTGHKKTTVGTFFPFASNYIDMLMSNNHCSNRVRCC